MTRSRKQRANRERGQHAGQHVEEGPADASISHDSSYPPPPGPPPELSTSNTADVAEALHPQTTQASFVRLTSGSSRQEALTESRADPDEHMPDCSIYSDHLPAVVVDLPVSHGASALYETQPASRLAETPQPALPRIAVHASAVSKVQTSTDQQTCTISAGPTPQRLYYLWSPKHEQQDAAGGPGPSYTEAYDDGKKKLLKQGSSPFADVTKQQVARMATWEPDPADASHARKHMRPWWIRLFSPWQQGRKGDAEAVDGADGLQGKGAELAMSSWRWQLVVFLCCLVAMICYVDRAAMSIAIIPMSLQYGWSNSVKGAINRYMLLCNLFSMCMCNYIRAHPSSLHYPHAIDRKKTAGLYSTAMAWITYGSTLCAAESGVSACLPHLREVSS